MASSLPDPGTLIPHRAPFKFIDELQDAGADWMVGVWHVEKDMACFQGHFPGNPVLPGVLISEHVFQTAACLIYHLSEEDRTSTGTPVLTKINDARFRRIVRPGETLTTRVELKERLSQARYMKAKVQCGAERVATFDFVLALAPQ